MDKLSASMALALLALPSIVAAAVNCDQQMSNLKIDQQLECAQSAASQAELVKKMLEQRLSELLNRIKRTSKDDRRLTNMADLALKAKRTLAEITLLSADATKAFEKAKDASLQKKGSEKMISLTAEAISEAQAMATAASTARRESENADQRLEAAIISLQQAGTPAVQAQAISELNAAGASADNAKQQWDSAKKDLVAKAAQLAKATPLEYNPADRLLAEQLEIVFEKRWKVVAEGNSVMLAMMGPFDDGDMKENLKQQAFLMFLESHPLLNSEISGSGIQLTSTAGDGKVTIKQAFQWGRTSNQHISLTLAAPINKDAENSLSASRNNVLLDKLAGDTTIKLDYTKIKALRLGALDANGFSLMGASVELGYQQFAYFDLASSFADPAKPVKLERHNTSYSIAAYAGYSPADSKTLILLRYARQSELEAKQSVSVCPIATAPLTYVTCTSGPFGAPGSRKYNVMSLEARHAFTNFALSATLSYDRTSKVKAIGVPVFLSVFNHGYGTFGSAEPQFSAGLILGWRSDTHGSVGIFAGVPFSLARAD